MSKSHIPLVVLFLCASLAASPATAASNKQQTHSVGSIQVTCLKQVGAQYRPEEKRWYFYGGVGTAQWQAFYNCLDSYTMSKR